MPRCAECLFFDPNGDAPDRGWCYRYPPPPRDGHAPFAAPRPIVYEGSWCGEFRRRCPSCTRDLQLGLVLGMGGRVVGCPHG